MVAGCSPHVHKKNTASSYGTAPHDEPTSREEPKAWNLHRDGVKQSIYANWIKKELDSERSCLELPFTIVLLLSFSIMALKHLGQDEVLKVEDAIVNDIVENANFAWAHNFGHKGIHDVNSYADFWSWSRIGLLPLLAPADPWFYSESLAEAVPTPEVPTGMENVAPYDPGALPNRREFGYRQKTPVKNDYLRYNRMVGGFRFRQLVSTPSESLCFAIGEKEAFQRWLAKPCTEQINEEMPPDNYAAESFDEPERTEWFLTFPDDHATLIRHIVDMEDGCVSARAQNRSCLCKACAEETPSQPWLNELTRRVEISFMLYNAQYGLYCMAGINFWFNRAGQIHKVVNVRSSWAGMAYRKLADLVPMVIADFVWIASIVYVCKGEIGEVRDVIMFNNHKPWYSAIVDSYVGFWNLVDWFSIFIALLIIFAFFSHLLASWNVNSEFGQLVLTELGGNLDRDAYLAEVDSFYGKAENMYDEEKGFRFWLSIYPLVLMLRLFKSFAAQQRLAMVTDTFIEAKNDLLHFTIVFFSVYFCFSVNACLFFGQESLNFATLYRAMLSSFRAMIGDWDWDEMKAIGLLKAFTWFSTFTLVMVLILLNMLLAILMDAYGKVADAAETAVTLTTQMSEMWRRYRQSRRGERVRLNEIFDALVRDESKRQQRKVKHRVTGRGEAIAKVLSSNRRITPEGLRQIFPAIEMTQAERTLGNAQTKYDADFIFAFKPEDLQPVLERMKVRMENIARCAIWLGLKLQNYQQLEDERVPDSMPAPYEGKASIFSVGMDSSVGGHSPRMADDTDMEQKALEIDQHDRDTRESLEQLQLIARERTKALSDGVEAVLSEELQSLERRQKEQSASMEQMHSSLDGLRQLVYKLNQTCSEISVQVSHELGGKDGPTRATSSIVVGPPRGSLPPPDGVGVVAAVHASPSNWNVRRASDSS